jgi:hypothetical protein
MCIRKIGSYPLRYSLLDNILKPNERAAQNEEDIRGVDVVCLCPPYTRFSEYVQCTLHD